MLAISALALFAVMLTTVAMMIQGIGSYAALVLLTVSSLVGMLTTPGSAWSAGFRIALFSTFAITYATALCLSHLGYEDGTTRVKKKR